MVSLVCTFVTYSSSPQAFGLKHVANNNGQPYKENQQNRRSLCPKLKAPSLSPSVTDIEEEEEGGGVRCYCYGLTSIKSF
ncbi:hypothetical protein Ahy_A01g000121 isoform C [Arachis hypogaea]|uniref:Uncharacterized protein n=1 Tax=Arachis hypogaea TaxID=3818 RepID=A0A445EJD4_ARAHY|nr:hypothetical protein Ahy_A01g000121 isoform C [Arachis hypogaea]